MSDGTGHSSSGCDVPTTVCTPYIQVSEWLLRGSTLLWRHEHGARCTPLALLLCTGTWFLRVLHHGFSTNTVHHHRVLLLWLFCYCLTVFAPFLLFLNEVVTWFSHCQNSLEAYRSAWVVDKIKIAKPYLYIHFGSATEPEMPLGPAALIIIHRWGSTF